MFGKIMSIPDALLWSWYELLTDVPAAEIAARRRRVEEGAENPRDTKAELARRITADFHGAEAAARAEEDFRRAFSKGEVPEDVETRELPPESASAARALVALDLAASMREARRKIAEGALKVYGREARSRGRFATPKRASPPPDPSSCAWGAASFASSGRDRRDRGQVPTLGIPRGRGDAAVGPGA